MSSLYYISNRKYYLTLYIRASIDVICTIVMCTTQSTETSPRIISPFWGGTIYLQRDPGIKSWFEDIKKCPWTMLSKGKAWIWI